MFSSSIYKLFPALESKNYRYYFVGQLISQIGAWLQIVAQGWLVLTLTKSALLLGVVAASATLPSLLFSLFGGVLVDRFDKKLLIIITQFLSMILAFVLGILTILDVITVWHIIVLSFLLGVVGAIDMPARQAFVSEMVEGEKVASAVALNGSIWNLARIIGPSAAGILIALFGVGGAFIINAVSYIAAIYVQFLIVPIVHKKAEKHHPIEEIRQGIAYTVTHPIVRSLIILTAIVSIFGWSYATELPLIVEEVFHQDAAGLGYMYAAAGFGALVATFIVSGFARKFGASVFINGGLFLFAVSIVMFSFSSILWLSYLSLFISGFGLLSAFSIINAKIQHLVEPHFRGRVISIYLLMFVGLFPVGNLVVGFLSEIYDPMAAIRIGGVIVLVATIVGYLLKSKIKESHEEYVTSIEIGEGTREVMRDGRG